MFTWMYYQNANSQRSITSTTTVPQPKSEVPTCTTEEYLAAIRLGLPIQAKLAELRSMGYTIIGRHEIDRKLKLTGGVTAGIMKLDNTVTEIPLGILLKYEEELKKGVFDDIYIAEEPRANDPILLGSVFAKNSEGNKYRIYCLLGSWE